MSLGRFITARRVVISLLVVGGLVGLVLAFRWSETDDQAGSDGADAVEQLIPTRDAETLSQAPVGIDLAPGWTGVLVLNGQELPEDDLTRIDALNQVIHRPTDGLESGRNCVRAVIWRSAESRERSRNVDWCFEVT